MNNSLALNADQSSSKSFRGFDLRVSKPIKDFEFVSDMLDHIANPETFTINYSKFGISLRILDREIEYSISFHRNGSEINIYRFDYSGLTEKEGIMFFDNLQSQQILELWGKIKDKINHML